MSVVAMLAAAAPLAFAQGGPTPTIVLRRANIHCHTAYSDGYTLFWPEGVSPATAYQYGHEHGLGAMAVTDHGEMIDPTEWSNSITAALTACGSYWPFCAVHGFEWTGTTGHINVFGSQTRVGAAKTGQNTDADVFPTLGAVYGWLSGQAAAIDSSRPGTPLVVAQFNHPTADDQSDHHNNYVMPADPALRSSVALFEMGSWTRDPGNPFALIYEGTTAYNDTFDPRWSAEYWYRRALAEGWRLAPTISGDNHAGDYVYHHSLGPLTCTGIYMVEPPSTSTAEERRSAMLDAMRARRTFSAEDRDASIVVTADAGAAPQLWWMGTAFGPPPGQAVTVRVQASDPTDTITSVELICPDGTRVAQWIGLSTNSLDETVVLSAATLASLPATAYGEVCFYAKVTEADGELLFAAPLWISRPGVASTMSTPDVSGSTGPVVFSAVVQAADTHAALVGKAVLFRVDGVPVGTVASDSDGRAAMSWTIAAAVSYHLTAEFAGDAEAGGSWAERSVDSADFTLLTTLDRTGTVTELTTLRAYLKRVVDNSWYPGQTITFRIDGSVVGTGVTNSSGRADLNWTITAGPVTRTITAEFAGDVDFMPSSGQATLTSQVWSTKMAGFDRTARIAARTELKARLLRSDNAPLYSKSIDFTVDGTFVITRPTDVQGYARYPTYTIPDGAGAGARTILSSWAGNGGYLPVAKTATLTVSPALPYIWVLPKTVASGAKVGLYAYFRRLPDYQKQAGRTVDFRVDGTFVASAVTDAGGVARYSYQTVEAVGDHTIRCEFAGDAYVEAGYGEGLLRIY